jgi:triacylglycerol lipase
MTALSPQQAAQIAQGVYALRQEANLRTAFEQGAGLGIGDAFMIDDAVRLTGTSGLPTSAARSGFGLVAHGTGARHGELLVALRGTAVMRDWATDVRGGLQAGPRGHFVHAGFNDAFKSLRDQLRSAVAGGKPAAIHCVGHSLGSALATLAADYLSAAGCAGIHLYTFGSPRVGIGQFSSDLTNALGGTRIHRVYHGADPVSMIPLFPYAHVPHRGYDMRLDWDGGRVVAEAHLMDNYRKSIGQAGWSGLARPVTEPLDRDMRAWFEATNQHPLMFSANALWAITAALGWLVQEVLVRVVGTTFALGATLLDQLAWLLWQGALASRSIAAHAATLMQRILHFLGRGLQAGVNLSVAFVRWVLDLLLGAVTTGAFRALSAVFP